MKKLTMICMSALLMLAVSCKKDKKDEIENAGSGFRATVESHEGTGKTHLDDKAVKWDSGDAILVKSSTCTEPRGFTTTGSGATVNFDADAALPADFYAPPYTGYYPAGMFEGDQLTLPPTQQYDENNTFANGANPMAAASSETLLPFKNVCGVLKLQLYSTTACQVRSISITSNTGEKLHGTGAVGFDADGNPTLGTLSNGGSTLTLDMGSTGKLMGASESQSSAYYFVVPVNTLGAGFTVKVTDTDDKVWTKTANAPANLIARSQITVMPKLAVATHTPVSPSTVTVTAGCVSCTYSVGGTVTVPEGSHTCEYGLVYCPTSAGHIPTVADSKIVVNTEPINGSKTFTADLGVLENGVEYKVRAYAMIEGVTYSSDGTVKTVTGGDVPQPMTWTGGKSPKLFTVADPTPDDPNSGDETKVRFSQGNLQYIGSAPTPYWKFADHQFDFIGNGQNGSDASNIDRDLFGWGSTGNAPTGDDSYVNFQPWATSTSTVNTSYNDYGYGPSTNRPHPTGGVDERNLLVSNGSDWGANTIYAGTAPTTGWRTLTKDEWVYLINDRKDGSGELLYGEGMVGNCTKGLIILPDGWSCPSGLTDVVRGTSSWSNEYSYSDWAKLEAAGAVFLPAAGLRSGSSVGDVGSRGRYWSSSYGDSSMGAYNLNFSSGNVDPYDYSFRFCGYSLRLVSEN